MPQVSVVTSVYNGEAYLEECVNSILNQTFKDFEYIILNNGSTDRTPYILSRYTDPRLRIVHQENLGIVRSLNKGINLSSGNLIARLDADDYAFPQRLEKQVAFMEQYPEIDFCGTRYKELIGIKYFSPMVQFFEKDEDIRKNVSYFNPFSHSTIMLRKKAFLESGSYKEKFEYSHDYELWVRMLRFGSAWILNEELSVVRLTEQSTSYDNRRKQKLEGLYIRWNAFRQFGANPITFMYYYLKSLCGLLLPSKRHLYR
jgi:glycosyltransferase involved in cell wall biosynthesis